MDGQRLDDLARLLGRGASRRTLIKGFIGGLGASIVALGLPRTPGASATALPPCNANDTCNQPGAVCTLEGVCDPDAACGRIVGCPTGYYCDNSECVVPCVETGGGCAADEDCCDQLVCTEGACAESDVCLGSGAPCENGDVCCSGVCTDGVCANPDACAPYNEACSFPAVTVAASLDGSNCCEGYCLEGICVPACIGDGGTCASNDDCCSDLTCTEGVCEAPLGACGEPGDACEMIEDHGCCPGLTCFEGICDNPSGLCMDKWEYCDGKHFLCCKGLICGTDSFCHPEKKDEETPHEPAKPQGGPAVSTLPSTGSGPSGDGTSWINAAALGGAAAVLGGTLLRKKQTEAETDAREQ